MLRGVQIISSQDKEIKYPLDSTSSKYLNWCWSPVDKNLDLKYMERKACQSSYIQLHRYNLNWRFSQLLKVFKMIYINLGEFDDFRLGMSFIRASNEIAIKFIELLSALPIQSSSNRPNNAKHKQSLKPRRDLVGNQTNGDDRVCNNHGEHSQTFTVSNEWKL